MLMDHAVITNTEFPVCTPDITSQRLWLFFPLLHFDFRTKALLQKLSEIHVWVCVRSK